MSPTRPKPSDVRVLEDPAQQTLEALALGVMAVDRDCTVLMLNRWAEKITGVSRSEALGQPCRRVLASSLCEQDCPVRRAMETGQEQHDFDAVLIRQDGRSVVPVKVSAAPLRNKAGRVVGGVETIQGFDLAHMLDRAGHDKFGWHDFVGTSASVSRMFETLKVAAPSNVTILIEGATGTGKDLLANIIHQQSPRRGRPLIKVNCAALPENLLESELFGYQRGAFTGAERDKPGRFQLADGGTIFLDEISEMPLALQAKLLRVLEDREFYPLGSRKTCKVDVRIIAACNRPLDQEVDAGRFRADLFYRLNVIHILVPPLKERPEDVPLLIRRYIQRKNVERGTYICRMSPETLDLLLNYEYPGNVREMENILEHACLLCQGDVIQCDHLPWYLRNRLEAMTAEHPAPSGDGERERLANALARCDWNRTRTAELLGIDRTTLWRRMKRLGLDAP